MTWWQSALLLGAGCWVLFAFVLIATIIQRVLSCWHIHYSPLLCASSPQSRMVMNTRYMSLIPVLCRWCLMKEAKRLPVCSWDHTHFPPPRKWRISKWPISVDACIAVGSNKRNPTSSFDRQHNFYNFYQWGWGEVRTILRSPESFCYFILPQFLFIPCPAHRHHPWWSPARAESSTKTRSCLFRFPWTMTRRRQTLPPSTKAPCLVNKSIEDQNIHICRFSQTSHVNMFGAVEQQMCRKCALLCKCFNLFHAYLSLI